MNDSRVALARYRMGRAWECLEEGRVLLASGKFNATANRAYYAAFYATRALLALRGLDAARHSGVIALFNREYVRSGQLPKDTGRGLQRLFDARIEADYRDLVTLERSRAEALLAEAAGFLHAVAELLEREISRGQSGDAWGTPQ